MQLDILFLLMCAMFAPVSLSMISSTIELASAQPARILQNTSTYTIWADGILSKLHQDGVVFVRDTPFANSQELARLRESLEAARMGVDLGKEYGRRGVFDRAEKAPGIFSVVGDVGPAHILPHSEGAYMPTTASFIMFACPGPASEGGSTPAVKIQDVQDEIQVRLPEVYEKIRKHGVWYVRFFPDESSSEFNAFTEANYPTLTSRYANRSRETIEEELKSQNVTWVWWTNGSRLSSPVRNAAPWPWNTRGEVPGSGSGLEIWWWMPGFVMEGDDTPVWFNQITLNNGRYLRSLSNELGRFPLHRQPFHTLIGNGEELSDEEYLVLSDIHHRHEQLFTWAAGDILVVDNFRYMHGRTPFRGHRECLVGYGPSKEWVSSSTPALPTVCSESRTVRMWHPACDSAVSDEDDASNDQDANRTDELAPFGSARMVVEL